jgi:hypothetical protein
MEKDIEYLLNNYLKSNGNIRAYKQLILALKCDLIYKKVKNGEAGI